MEEEVLAVPHIFGLCNRLGGWWCLHQNKGCSGAHVGVTQGGMMVGLVWDI